MAVHLEDTSRVSELELLGAANGLKVFADEDISYFLLMAKKILLDGKTIDGRGYLMLADIE